MRNLTWSASVEVSIAPLWNWKLRPEKACRYNEAVSIAPLWNWKRLPRDKHLRRHWRFNRTFMELKGRWYTSRSRLSPVSIAPLWNWKVCCQQVQRLQCCFNRTFMELKGWWCRGIEGRLWFQSHLYGIESDSRNVSCSPLHCFNRTFMELKVVSGVRWHQPYHCFNRTFMELKVELGRLFYVAHDRFNRTFMELKVRPVSNTPK